MSILGPFGFGAPWVLLGLLALPVVWLVVRAIPPRPSQVRFPPTDILKALPKTEETPATAPPWLAILRAVALGLVILGLSGPVLNPPKEVDNRPLLIVIDDGWTAAPLWRETIEEAVAIARSATGPVRIVTTAPQIALAGQDDVLTPASAAARLAASTPQPVLSDHVGAVGRLAGLPRGQRIIWFSDNVGRSGTPEFALALSRLGPVKLRVIASPAVALTRVEATQNGYNIGYRATTAGQNQIQIEALNAKSRALTSIPTTRDRSSVVLPVETALNRDVAAIRTANVPSAGGVFLLDAFDRRVRAGIVAARQDDQPLLSDAFYLAEAIRPFAEVSRGDITQLTASGLDVILLPDAAQLPPTDEQALLNFVKAGGLLVRFSGPRAISAGDSATFPAPLAAQSRQLRGALAWDDAGSLAPFDRTSPFAGLTIPTDARANQIAVFAPPSGEATAAPAPQTWARLNDATPLVSAAPLGRGWRVLFHTTAGPAWSDVAFSGLQVSMLRRVLARANSTALPATALTPTAPLKPVLVLDGFGAIIAPKAEHQAIAPQNVAGVRPDARHPPGIYEGGGSRLILQAATPETLLPALPVLPSVERTARSTSGPIAWGPSLLGLGLMILVLDMIVALAFAGCLTGSWKRPSLPQLWRRNLAALALAALTLAFLNSPNSAYAQAAQLPLPPNPKAAPSRSPADMSLAYIRTGDAATDARARAGLEGLSRVLAARTSVEPGPVVGIDPTSDDLALYPLLYWLLPDTPIQTPPESARALDRYMKTGGVIFVDTRGAGRDPAIARNLSRAALRGLEAPPLEPVPEGHVLTKSFYLLRGFPGRYQNARLWVETGASAASSANDGVSPLIVGDGDWASAWARAAPMTGFGALDGAQRNQEIAARVGVNVVLYALTGNYKADQVHFETLLRRLTPR
jgi:hypothetical protein